MFGIGSGKSIVGLDIGSSCIKAIELKRSKGEIVVSHLGVEPLASDIVVDSMIVDSGSVSSAISKIFAEHAIKTKSVATSVSGHSVIVKKISVQPMSEGELAESIKPPGVPDYFEASPASEPLPAAAETPASEAAAALPAPAEAPMPVVTPEPQPHPEPATTTEHAVDPVPPAHQPEPPKP